MQKLSRSILCAGRKRRRRAAGIALWLLRQIRDAEKDEMRRYECRLDKLDRDGESVPARKYAALEDECLNCEYALDTLELVIEELELEYCLAAD